MDDLKGGPISKERTELRKRVRSVPESVLQKTLELANDTKGEALTFEQRKYWTAICDTFGVTPEAAVDAAVAYSELYALEPPPPPGVHRFFVDDPKNPGHEIQFEIRMEYRIHKDSVAAYQAERELALHRRSLLGVLAAYGQTFVQGDPAWKRIMTNDEF